MTERELTDAVIETARILGWTTAHFRPGRTSHGWRTPMQGTPGFPDLVLVRDRLVFAELKVGRNKPSAGQRHWLDALDNAGVETYLWTDRDWLSGVIEQALR